MTYVATKQQAHHLFGQNHAVAEQVALAAAVFQRSGDVPNHGDFRSANWCAARPSGGGGRIGVIDWTDSHVGRREEDLGGCEPEHLEALLAACLAPGPVVISRALVA